MAHTILVVDDSAVARTALARRLRQEGLDVVEAASLADVVRLPMTFDRAILDLELGDADGVVVANHLTAQEPTLRVAFFTAGPEDTGLVGRARSKGPVFQKPEDLDAAVAWATFRGCGAR